MILIEGGNLMNKSSVNKLIMFLIIILTALLIVGCGDNNEGASTDQDSNHNEQNEPMTISFMLNLRPAEVPSNMVADILEEKLNVKLDIDWVPDSSYGERLNTAFATTTLPEVVSVGVNQLDLFREAIVDDQFWEIGPYLDQFENLKKLKEPILNNTKVEGKLYGLYQGRPLSRQGFIYRKDWADNLGLEAPTTTEDFFEMVRAFTEDDPDGNGKDDTIGLTDRGDLIYGAFKTISSWFGTPNNWGEKDGELLPEFMFPEYVETMKFIKEIRDNSYMNLDFPVTSKDDQVAMFKNGTAGIYVGAMGDVVHIYNDAIELNPDAAYDVQNYVEGPNGEFNVWAIPGFGSMVLFPKSAVESEEKLLKILAFYDHLMTPEYANLIRFGKEGEHYTVIDGKADPIDGEGAEDLYTRDIRPYLALEIGEPETNGRYDEYHEYEVQMKAEELILDNENYLLHDPTISLESETFIKDGERLQAIVNDATNNFMLGEIDEEGFYKEIEKWKEQGGSKIIEEYNNSK